MSNLGWYQWTGWITTASKKVGRSLKFLSLIGETCLAV